LNVFYVDRYFYDRGQMRVMLKISCGIGYRMCICQFWSKYLHILQFCTLVSSSEITSV